jgi:drug/metabolite transporter (DMT)-like permease
MAFAGTVENKSLAYGLVFSVQVVFTGYQLLAKVALSGKGVNPISFALIRAVGTTVVLFALGCMIDSKPQVYRRSFNPAHMPQFVLLGISMAANVLGLIFALEHTSSGMVAILQVLRPIFAGVISKAMGMERFSNRMLMGVAVCLIGTTMITTQGAALAKPGESMYLGVFFVCIHSMGQAMYVIHQPALLDAGYSPFMVNSGAFLVATFIIASMFGIPSQKLHEGVWWDSSPFFIGLTLYSILMVGVYCYCAMGWAAKKIGGTSVMLFMLLQAILTTTSGRIFLHEEMNLVQVLGGALILAGITVYIFGKEDVQASLKMCDVQTSRRPSAQDV